MKQKVSLSNFSVIFTLLTIVFFIGLMFLLRNPEGIILLAGYLIVISLFALFFLPLSMSVDDKQFSINLPLRTKSIPFSDIISIESSQIEWNAMRLLNSGGFLGYWGWFHSPEPGRYFAYSGRKDDCFLVTLKNGMKYMLGCDNSQKMIDYISERINPIESAHPQEAV